MQRETLVWICLLLTSSAGTATPPRSRIPAPTMVTLTHPKRKEDWAIQDMLQRTKADWWIGASSPSSSLGDVDDIVLMCDDEAPQGPPAADQGCQAEKATEDVGTDNDCNSKVKGTCCPDKMLEGSTAKRKTTSLLPTSVSGEMSSAAQTAAPMATSGLERGMS